VCGHNFRLANKCIAGTLTKLRIVAMEHIKKTWPHETSRVEISKSEKIGGETI
jgi:hypothetical protein